MPCFDKKLEAAREDFLDPVHGRDVDCVLTSVEIEQVLLPNPVVQSHMRAGPYRPKDRLSLATTLACASTVRLSGTNGLLTLRNSFSHFTPDGNALGGVAGGSGGYAETVLRQAALVLHNHTLGEIQWRQGRSPDVKEASLEVRNFLSCTELADLHRPRRPYGLTLHLD